MNMVKLHDKSRAMLATSPAGRTRWRRARMDNCIRTCQKCGEVKSLSEFRRHHTGNVWGDPYRKACKACMSTAKPKLPEGMKQCRQCGEVKPKTTEYFRSNGQRADLFKPVCKACTNLPPAPPVPEGMQRCSKCEQIKPATTAFFHRRGERGLRPICIPCFQVQTLAWQRANPDKVRAIQQRQNFLDRTVPERQEKRRLAMRARYRKNPYKFLAAGHQRRVLLRASPTQFTPADVERQFQQQGGKCYWCRKKLGSLEQRDFHVDHIFAVARGGSNGPENICCACAACNLSKNAKSPLEWIGRLF